MSASIPSWAVRGAKVVCVETGDLVAENGSVCNPGGALNIGVVYTLRQIVRDKEGICVRLKGLYRGLLWRDTPFLLERFRPAQTDGGASEVEARLFRMTTQKHRQPVDA